MRANSFLQVAPEIDRAVDEGRAVVALESTIISHGLPRPLNFQTATEMEAAVRSEGAVPATVGVIGGRLVVGLTSAELELLARDDQVLKVSPANLAAALSDGVLGATTVAATMIAAHAAGIRVFATGGIGGVHPGAFGGSEVTNTATLDVSADLEELAHTPVAVVCAGPKAIVDIAKTVEYLETRGVPVVTIGSSQIPAFYTRGSGVDSPVRAESARDAARTIATHFGLGLRTGLLIAVPVPEDDEHRSDLIGSAIQQATREASRANVRGASLTPWMLRRLEDLTDGWSTRVNISLVMNNARVAATIACLLAASA
ncbi:MAG: pseudouridine-5'-phosphate glycosidase [Chloroflexota bacterium]